MNWGQLQNRLIAVARRNPPSNKVPYAFEKRVMAGIAALRPKDDWTSLLRIMSWSAASFAAIALATSIWSTVPDPDTEAAHRFSAELEQTILASVDDVENVW